MQPRIAESIGILIKMVGIGKLYLLCLGHPRIRLALHLSSFILCCRPFQPFSIFLASLGRTLSSLPSPLFFSLAIAHLRCKTSPESAL